MWECCRPRQQQRFRSKLSGVPANLARAQTNCARGRALSAKRMLSHAPENDHMPVADDVQAQMPEPGLKQLFPYFINRKCRQQTVQEIAA